MDFQKDEKLCQLKTFLFSLKTKILQARNDSQINTNNIKYQDHSKTNIYLLSPGSRTKEGNVRQEKLFITQI